MCVLKKYLYNTTSDHVSGSARPAVHCNSVRRCGVLRLKVWVGWYHSVTHWGYRSIRVSMHRAPCAQLEQRKEQKMHLRGKKKDNDSNLNQTVCVLLFISRTNIAIHILLYYRNINSTKMFKNLYYLDTFGA